MGDARDIAKKKKAAEKKGAKGKSDAKVVAPSAKPDVKTGKK